MPQHFLHVCQSWLAGARCSCLPGDRPAGGGARRPCGNKAAFAFSEFADPEPKRKGVAISRLAAGADFALARPAREKAKMVTHPTLHEKVSEAGAR